MGDDDEGLPQLVAQVEEELVQLLLVLCVEATRGLVGKDYLRAVDEGAGHGYALLLSTRELGRLVGGTVGEVQVVEHLHSAAAGIAHAGSGNEGGHHHVLHGGEFGQQLVKLEYEADMPVAEGRELLLLISGDVDAIEEHTAAVGAVERADYLQQRGLAGSAGTYDADHLSLVDGEVDAFEHFECAEALVYVVELYHILIILTTVNGQQTIDAIRMANSQFKCRITYSAR